MKLYRYRDLTVLLRLHLPQIQPQSDKQQASLEIIENVIFYSSNRIEVAENKL